MKHQKDLVLARVARMGLAMMCTIALSSSCDTASQPSPLPNSTPAGPVSPPGLSGPTGSYALTLTASPSCANVTATVDGQTVSFPDSARVRRYDAKFANGFATLKRTDGTGNAIDIGGNNSYFTPGTPLMTLKDGTLTIIVPPPNGQGGFGGSPCNLDGFSWHEVSSAGELFALCGTWRGSMADESHAEGSIAGSFEYYVNEESRSGLSCYATDHQFTLTLMPASSTARE